MTRPDHIHRELHEQIARFSTFGATKAGGIHRPEATAANGEARDALVAWLRESGFEVRIDAIGNIFGLAGIAGPEAPGCSPARMSTASRMAAGWTAPMASSPR
ncbi:MAG: hypothetical protein R3D25_04005 [Geminicoccaceae bacterium]